ncbi:MAG: hypothetical protein ACFFDN_29170 [Candidatus Hodarchaeota archaeon]
MAENQKLSKDIEDIKKDLDNLHYIENQDINRYLLKKNSEIIHSDIAHLYFILSTEVYKLLRSDKIYKKKLKVKFRSIQKLREGYDEILRVSELITLKRPEDISNRKESRDSLFHNKNYLLNSLNHYESIITSIEGKRFSYLAIIISISAIVTSIFKPC